MNIYILLSTYENKVKPVLKDPSRSRLAELRKDRSLADFGLVYLLRDSGNTIFLINDGNTRSVEVQGILSELREQKRIEFKKYFTISLKQFLENGMAAGDMFVSISDHRSFREHYEAFEKDARRFYELSFSHYTDSHLHIRIVRAIEERIPEKYWSAIDTCLRNEGKNFQRFSTMKVFKLPEEKIAVLLKVVSQYESRTVVLVADENQAKIVIGERWSDNVDDMYLSRSEKSLVVKTSEFTREKRRPKEKIQYFLIREVF